MPTVAFRTLGCKINQYDTEAARAALARAGYDAVAFEDEADVYVINTCTVTARSDQKCRQVVRRLCRRRPAARVIVTGCYADLHPVVFEALSPNVVVVPNREKPNIPALLGADLPGGGGPVRFAGRTRTFLKVQDGCDHACSYCVIRDARGPSRSRPPAQVREDVLQAAAEGVKEIVIAGVDLGSYGRDLSPRSTLADLVSDLVSLDGDFRLRLSSVDVADVGEDLIAACADGDRLCPHWHLPLQSGDDAVLRGMRRRYRVDDYRRVVGALLDARPDAALGTDVMTGFPGENDAAFEETYRLIEELPFSYLHVFPYSERPGTDALRLGAAAAPEVRERRAQRLRELGAVKREQFRRRFDGAERRVLIEDGGAPLASGVTDNYIRVALKDYSGPTNVLISAQLTCGDGVVWASPTTG